VRVYQFRHFGKVVSLASRLRRLFFYERSSSILWVVPWTGLEPAHLAKYAPQTYVSTNFTTRANFSFYEEQMRTVACPHFSSSFCDPAGIRTQGPYIKSVLLYQLSYEIIFRFPKKRAQIYSPIRTTQLLLRITFANSFKKSALALLSEGISG
jgi:hypothetical protein